MSFMNEERGNITLWILYVVSGFLVIAAWIIIFNLIQVHVLPVAVASGAEGTRPYGYIVTFWKWFPVIVIAGYSLYAIVNSQKPEQDRRFA